jgi:hypothetical protein
MGACHQLDGLGLRGVAGQGAVVRPVQPHDLSQQMSVTSIGLRPGRGVPFPVAGYRHGVNREHLIPSGHQCGHPRPPVGLDADLDPVRSLTRRQAGPLLRQVGGYQGMQLRHPRQPLRQPLARQPPPGIVHDLNVVVIFGPVVPDKQHHASWLVNGIDSRAEEIPSDLMVKCSPPARGTTSHQRSNPLTTSGRTVCRKTSCGRKRRVLTCRPLPEPSLPKQSGRSHEIRTLVGLARCE